MDASAVAIAKYATGYFDRMAEVVRRTEATDGTGVALPFDDAVGRAAAMVARVKRTAGRKVMFVGNGGSAGMASHQATDYLKNGGVPALAFNDGAMLTCLGNDLGYEQVFARPIQALAQPGDLLVAISSSGQSPNILAAARQGRESGCTVITLSAFKPENPLRQLGDLNFYVPTMAYGYAEILHLAITHCVLDGLMEGALS